MRKFKFLLRKLKFPVGKPKFLPGKLFIYKIPLSAANAISQKWIIFTFFTFIFDKTDYALYIKCIITTKVKI
ncbi:hypothetical protein ABW11_01475 [Pluralibacter gergoviae]|nr:hypothetical protein LG71_08060 [Pluralibacter gergoviae]KMK05741.1 hypothetical protein ABW07_19515 [Pluralibacter gergoviae]KMK19168.1 hypothetical protein ABW09_07245 [Pluralibacter gergoviae]KMK25963.1 hypothetical protein ABW10_04445 [Pluralibacter gergoviae]KMK30238.1 hypothetical protein ABW11_01475 [Pluralibacter gergoviae]